MGAGSPFGDSGVAERYHSHEANFLLNPAHPDFKKSPSASPSVAFDPRLLT
jgi:hypothetical protein